ncbi:MAG TPA: Asp-tRNA(Asn)/Glu-tRNA(Gln) amidotransferase subunit GatB [Patescibacteria group bacterium]|nr:Asp-tRNA(Asn)/Glu-tRNA(Gln) amidotransferase subunit GatB [Patescibacteria group bacterium]
MKYIPTVGLEVHLQLATKSKMFCGCSNTGEKEPPNTTVCPICMGHPGTLPVPNADAIAFVVRAGFAIGCEINTLSKFDRKNYFYPDLPKGYQISQYDLPLCKNGSVDIGEKKIGITRIHLEEDTAKLMHAPDKSSSIVDFNRSGSPLMELVSEPECENAAEAKHFCQELQRIFRYIGISDADMEKGHMRCEANVSIRPEGTDKLGTKVEVKNINSFRAVEKAIEYEIQRQTELLDSGKKVAQETRGWNDKKLITVSQRSKEEAHDYRYFPEPDIPPLELSSEYLSEIKKSIHELPLAKKRRFMNEYGFSQDAAMILTETWQLADWTEQVISELREWLSDLAPEKTWDLERDALMKLVSGWITSELFKHMNADKKLISEILITPENFSEFLTFVYLGKINSSSAQIVLSEMYGTGADPSHIIEAQDLSQVNDDSLIVSVIDQVIAEYPKQSEEYRSGKMPVLQFLIGKVMAATKGKANPERVKELIMKKFTR